MTAYSVYICSGFIPGTKSDKTLRASRPYYVVYDRRTMDMRRATHPCLDAWYWRHPGAGKLVPAYTKMHCSQREYDREHDVELGRLGRYFGSIE
jgi:hypothetical protein